MWSRFLVPFFIWLAVAALALFLLQEKNGSVAFGLDQSRVWAFGAILLGAILGIGFRYVFKLTKPEEFNWFGLLKPLCISPIVVLPLVGTLQPTGDIEALQIIMFGLLAFQNGFFWTTVLKRAEGSISAE